MTKFCTILLIPLISKINLTKFILQIFYLHKDKIIIHNVQFKFFHQNSRIIKIQPTATSRCTLKNRFNLQTSLISSHMSQYTPTSYKSYKQTWAKFLGSRKRSPTKTLIPADVKGRRFHCPLHNKSLKLRGQVNKFVHLL